MNDEGPKVVEWPEGINPRVVAAVVAVVLLCVVGVVVHEWIEDGRWRTHSVYLEEVEARVDTTYYQNTPVRRSLTFDDGDFVSGPLSESGRRHGEWSWLQLRGDHRPHVEKMWYWYGEQVTEGRWHALNR